MVRIYTKITNLPTFQSEIGQQCFYEKLSHLQIQLMDSQIATLYGHNILLRALRNFRIINSMLGPQATHFSRSS